MDDPIEAIMERYLVDRDLEGKLVEEQIRTKWLEEKLEALET